MSTEREVALLEDLVQVRSPSGEEREAVGLFTERLAAWGLETHIDEAGNAVAEVGRGDQLIVLLGHIDTVTGWPEVRRDGDKLWGRGSVDAKGPLCAFAGAAARLTAEDLADRRIVVIGAVEEEAPTSKGARFVRDRLAPDFCVIGEPSGWRGITLGYKGRVLLDAEVRADRSHSAGREATAAERGAALWQAVLGQAEAAGGEREFERLLPTLMTFDTEAGDLEERARLRMSLRLPPGFDVDGFGAAIQEAFPDATCRLAGHERAFRTDRKNALVRAFLRGIRSVGGQPRFLLKTGTSDMNVVGPAWGCPIVAYGPGDSALDHRPDEHIQIPEYLRAIDVLTHALRSVRT